MVIKRQAYQLIKKKLQPRKVLVLYGPRRVGKTFILEKLKKEYSAEEVKFLNGESLLVQDDLSVLIPERYQALFAKTKLLIIDEAQKVPKTGEVLKMIVDSLPKLKVIASGSASFSLAQKVGEPLTGRKKTIILYPVAAQELINTKGLDYYRSTWEDRLIFGNYPELFNLSSRQKQKEYLDELIDSYLFRDLLEMETVKNAKKIRDLLTLIAFQIGKEVSLTELGNNLGLNKATVGRYLDLLEKSFVIINIRGFSRNLRKEIVKNSRYYFYDNGVRNSLINNFNPLKIRNDSGQLWENYLVLERLKKQKYTGDLSNNYFWRTYDQKEIDWVEEKGGRLYGYEITLSDKLKKAPKDWLKAYPGSSYQVINKTNFLDFISW